MRNLVALGIEGLVVVSLGLAVLWLDPPMTACVVLGVAGGLGVFAAIVWADGGRAED